MIKAQDLRDLVIIPALEELAAYDDRMNTDLSVDLLMGIAAQESDLGYNLKQVNGPALGPFQIEPITHKSLWNNFISFRPQLEKILWGMVASKDAGKPYPSDEQLITNLEYSAAICRIRCWIIPEAIPDTLEGQAAQWNKYYNGNPDKGTDEEYIESYKEFVV